MAGDGIGQFNVRFGCLGQLSRCRLAVPLHQQTGAGDGRDAAEQPVEQRIGVAVDGHDHGVAHRHRGHRPQAAQRRAGVPQVAGFVFIDGRDGRAQGGEHQYIARSTQTALCGLALRCWQAEDAGRLALPDGQHQLLARPDLRRDQRNHAAILLPQHLGQADGA